MTHGRRAIIAADDTRAVRSSAALAANAAAMSGFLARARSRLAGVDLPTTAASLAFTTILGLVPLATVALAVVAQFPSFESWLDTFEQWLTRVLLPGDVRGNVRIAVTGFAEQAARLSGVTLAFVVVTALFLVSTVERAINRIFGVKRLRPAWRRFAFYLAAVLLGPVLAGASLSATSWVVAQSLQAIPRHDAIAWSIGRLSWLVAVAALIAVYKVAPACPVRWRHAFAGAFLAGLALEAAKEAFAWYVAHVPTYQQIYGALAILPLFMLWVYVGWLIVLAGAAVTASLTPGVRGARE